jgi:hypothetical protein
VTWHFQYDNYYEREETDADWTKPMVYERYYLVAGAGVVHHRMDNFVASEHVSREVESIERENRGKQMWR